MSNCISDLPPEYCQYQDNGCEFAPSCLNCPLPVCIYDEQGGRQRLLKKRRAEEMARLLFSEGKNIKEVAQIYNISTRTVQRALKTTFGDKQSKDCHSEPFVSQTQGELSEESSISGD